MVDDVRIPDAELRAYRAELRGSIFRQLHLRLQALKEAGFTQEEMAELIAMQPSQLSRLLKGENDLQLDTLSDLSRALGCRIVAAVVPLHPKPKIEGTTFVFEVSTGAQASRTLTPTASRKSLELKVTESVS